MKKRVQKWFSKHQLVKFCIRYVYIKLEVDTKIMKQQWLQVENYYLMGGGMAFLITEEVN